MRSRPLLAIRWWQVRKELTGIGLLYAAAVLLILCVMICFVFTQYALMPNACIVAGCVVLSVLSIHIHRTDKAFISKHLPRPQQQMFVEYMVFTAALTLPSLLSRYWWLFILMQCALWLISRLHFTVRESVRFRFLSRWIDPQDFEWLSGLRRSLPAMLLLYIAAWSLSWIMVAPLVSLWLITVNIASCYTECEPLAMLHARHSSAKLLLRNKLKRHSLMLLLLSVPVLVLNCIFCPDMLWINAGFVLLQLLLLHFAILLKYALYTPGTVLSGNNVLMGIAALSAVIPFLLPIPLIMNVRNYRRALRNLEHYYHD